MNILVSLFMLVWSPLFAASNSQEKAQALYTKISNKFKVPEVSIADAKQSLKKSEAILIDVREPAERKVSVIPGSISRQEYEENSGQYKAKKLIVYCTVGYRSAKYVQALRKQNLNALNLKGSILGWVHSEKSLVDLDGKPTKRVHVYGNKWNLLPEGFTGLTK